MYDLEGLWKRSFGQDFLISPSGFALLGDHLVVAELHARLVILDADDGLACILGEDPAAPSRKGWSNDLDRDGVPIRSRGLRQGLFNSPPGVTTDHAGNIYVSEWLIGGRYTKLARL